MTDRHVTLTVFEQALVWTPADDLTYADVHVVGAPGVTYRARWWESSVVESAFAATEFIPSWNAHTPEGSWLLVEARLESDLGWSPWLTFARWCDDGPRGSGPITRTTVPGQTLEAGHVDADTFLADVRHPYTAWQVRLTGLVAGERDPWPEVLLVAAAVAAIRVADDTATSEPASATGALGAEIAVPPLSQRRHVDTFPEWDNGGQSWCSPTSTTMLLAHWGLAPSAGETAWVGHEVDPEVVHGVSRVYDASYGGAGNWAFNAAYAGARGLRAYVTRLRDLTEVEAFVAAGIPLVVSVTFTAEQLDGAGYGTNGHLLTVVGFTADGDVVSNDPNSHRVASNDRVRTVYRRDQFERVWLGANGGLTYVMHPHDVPLPTPPAEANWA